MPSMIEKHKIVSVHNDIGNGIEVDDFHVTEYDVTYDARGVLRISSFVESDYHTVFYGPDTWKFVELFEEEKDTKFAELQESIIEEIQQKEALKSHYPEET